MTEPMAHPLADIVVPTGAAHHSSVVIEATPAGVVVVNLNRPARANRLDAEMVAALTDAFVTLRAQEHVRLVFVRGVDGFCAGLSVEWLRESLDWSAGEQREDAKSLADMLERLREIPAFTVALVEGEARGIGAALVAACDTAIAAEGATFAFDEVIHGLSPAISAPYVAQAVGARVARRLLATGVTIGAEAALRIGLVEAVAADGDGLHTAARKLAHELAKAAPEAVGEAKAALDRVLGWELDGGVIDDAVRGAATWRDTPTAREGVAALLEARTPTWAVLS